MSTSKFLHLFTDSKTVDPFEIQATPTDTIFSYANKPLKFNGDVQYKNGAVYVSLVSKFGLVDQSVTNEVTRSNQAEILLGQRIDNEQIRSQDSENSLLNSLQSEITRSTNVDTNFQTSLSAEILSRSGSDTKLTTDLNFEVNRASVSENLLMTFIVGEQTSRSTGDTVLSGLIDTETKSRVLADSNESKTRLDSDNALGLLISNEVIDRQNNVVGVSNMLEGYILTEKTRAMLKESQLQNQINFFVSNSDPSSLDSLAELVSKLNSAGTDLYQRMVYLESVVSTLRGEPLYAVTQPVYVPGIVPTVP